MYLVFFSSICATNFCLLAHMQHLSHVLAKRLEGTVVAIATTLSILEINVGLSFMLEDTSV